MLGREKTRKQNVEARKQVAQAQEQDEVANFALYYNQKAKEYLEKITKEPFGLSSFISKNETQLNAMAGKKEFNIQHALTGKKNYREYKILVNFITAKMTLKEIDIPSQGELF